MPSPDSLETFRATIETLGLDGTEQLDGAPHTLRPAMSAPDTDMRERIAGLPRLHTDPGTSEGRLEIGATLGQGGMGIVRSAEQVPLGRKVAIKSLRPELLGGVHVLSLLREAWITGGLEHPNIIPIYMLGVDSGGSPMIVMKQIEGTPWSDYLSWEAEPPLEEPRDLLAWNLGILIQVCNAIEFAAAKGILHRDLKPSNVMVGSFGEVYVLDWGIALSIEPDPTGRFPCAKDVRSVAGTPGYMAPEMVNPGTSPLDQRTDVYLLGAMLHEVLTGQRRHLGGSLLQILFSSSQSLPAEYDDQVPKEIGDIANKACAAEPSDRFASAAEFRSAIVDFLNHQGSRDLADRALEALAGLHAELRAEVPDPAVVHDLYSASSFGFRSALEMWSENDVATEGLENTLSAMASFHIARESAESARILIAEIVSPAPALVAQLRELEERLSARHSEVAELHKMRAGRDLLTGTRTRAFLAILLGLEWFSIPVWIGVVAKTHQDHEIYELFFQIWAGMAVATTVVTLWARESLTRTDVNRQLTYLVMTFGIMTLLTRLVGVSFDAPFALTAYLDFVLGMSLASAASFTIDRRLLPTVGMYLAGFVAASLLPRTDVYYVLACTALCAELFTAFVWRPAHVFETPEERQKRLEARER